MKKLLIFSMLLVSLLAFTACSNGDPDYAVDSSDNTEILVEIPKGTLTMGIAQILVDNGLIESKGAFKGVAVERGADKKFKAGTYKLSKSMTLGQIIDKIANGEVYIELVKVTVPEGFELKQIISLFVDNGLGSVEGFNDALNPDLYDYKFLSYLENKSLEGYLFPATYSFKPKATEQEIVSAMLVKFDSVFKDEYYARIDEMGMTLNELVTMASIVEREGKLDEERALIASVFYNRLEIGMRFQSCATVQYILGERKDVLTNADVATESPYNTYLNSGLPPGPIASPGEKSIVASLYPVESEYLFFQTKIENDGSHYFAKTAEEHNAYKNKKKQ